MCPARIRRSERAINDGGDDAYLRGPKPPFACTMPTSSAQPRSQIMRVLILLAAFLLNFIVPALADDVANAQSVIRAQEDAFRRDDAPTAYYYAAPGIREMFPRPDIF